MTLEHPPPPRWAPRAWCATMGAQNGFPLGIVSVVSTLVALRALRWVRLYWRRLGVACERSVGVRWRLFPVLFRPLHPSSRRPFGRVAWCACAGIGLDAPSSLSEGVSLRVDARSAAVALCRLVWSGWRLRSCGQRRLTLYGRLWASLSMGASWVNFGIRLRASSLSSGASGEEAPPASPLARAWRGGMVSSAAVREHTLCLIPFSPAACVACSDAGGASSGVFLCTLVVCS
jgi:hypothetical protein